MGGGDNLAQNQPLMPLKCQRLQKGRETAKIESTFIFQYGRCYNALMPLSECTQGHQEREKGKADAKKREMKKRKKDFAAVMEAAPSDGCLYSTDSSDWISLSLSLSP